MKHSLKDIHWPGNATHVVQPLNSKLSCLSSFKNQAEFDEWLITLDKDVVKLNSRLERNKQRFQRWVVALGIMVLIETMYMVLHVMGIMF